MRFFRLWVTVWIIILKVLHMVMGLTVQFPNKEPLYIATGRNLVLEAQLQLQQSEKVLILTWERKNSNGEVRVAENEKTHDNRTFVEENGKRLRIQKVTDSDYGTYKVTVTNGFGDQVNAQRDVLKITNPPKASLSMQCSVLGQGAQWDRPVFSWQLDGMDLNNQTGDVSEDGSTLLLTNPGQNYTCITDSSQGNSRVSVQFKASNPETNPEKDPTSPNSCSCSCTGWIVFAILEPFVLLCLFGVFFYCYKKRMSREQTI